ncbi:hypothetical protein CEXT_719711 [Caerostris extrusa]|uniref:Uncharacterized protein n=1 Tax=Caerostris extrusa TaxID=172846 RepID=A0AAV4W1P7_CAEEX|nr:hypothetical protein CEXT_719711 [Caerostris extrusa]
MTTQYNKLQCFGKKCLTVLSNETSSWQAVRRACLSIHQRAVHKIEMNVLSDTKIFPYLSAVIWENTQLLQPERQN